MAHLLTARNSRGFRIRQNLSFQFLRLEKLAILVRSVLVLLTLLVFLSVIPHK